jgi:hypothetical protein
MWMKQIHLEGLKKVAKNINVDKLSYVTDSNSKKSNDWFTLYTKA